MVYGMLADVANSPELQKNTFLLHLNNGKVICRRPCGHAISFSADFPINLSRLCDLKHLFPTLSQRISASSGLEM